MPVFNGENYLAEAIESILAQTVTDLELIICDNAPTDATEEISRRFAEFDERVQYFRNPKNLGVSPNLNLCYRYATGRYFKWLSHDDAIAPDCLEKTIAVLESDPDVVICHSLVKLIDENGTTLDIHDSKLRRSPPIDTSSPKPTFTGNDIRLPVFFWSAWLPVFWCPSFRYLWFCNPTVGRLKT